MVSTGGARLDTLDLHTESARRRGSWHLVATTRECIQELVEGQGTVNLADEATGVNVVNIVNVPGAAVPDRCPTKRSAGLKPGWGRLFAEIAGRHNSGGMPTSSLLHGMAID